MNICSSQSIIMRTIELGEADVIVTFLTRDKGRLKGVAKGARRSRKRFVNCLDIFSLVEMQYRLNNRSNLNFLDSARLIDSFSGIRSSYGIMAVASFMIELIESLLPWELPDPLMFDLLKKSLSLLTSGKDIEKILIIFEIMAISAGGYAFNLEKCCMCGRVYKGEGISIFKPVEGGIACMKCDRISAISPGLSPLTVSAVKEIQSNSLDTFENLDLSAKMITEIKPMLKLHREYHLGKRLRTSRFL
ncbi:MAG: DNA repair protein RecO [Deltaproteobacteria bacterium]|nr:DNA repair protein RecO [Deltaproteobacteria bacterium]